MLAFSTERRTDLEVEARMGASPGKRSPAGITHRTGYQERRGNTRAGRIGLTVPKQGKGSYFSSFLESRRSEEKALVAVIQEA